MIRYCFDLDGTLCNTINGDYENSTPFFDRIIKVNDLYEKGNFIIIETARGSMTNNDFFTLTFNQLTSWGVKFHELRVGVKKYADFYIDDKAIKDTDFFEK